MRRVRGLSLLILVGGLLPALLGLTRGEAAGACRASETCAVRLPAPVTIATVAAGYLITRDGRLRRIATAPSPHPRGTAWLPATDTWFQISGLHLVVGRGHRTLWRSPAQIAADRLGVIAAGPRAVAFQHDHLLYLARYGGAARPVGARELPLGWAAGGLYTYSYRRHRLLLRSDTGAIVTAIGPPRPHEYELDPRTGRLYFIAHGVLMGAHGARTWRLGPLRDFGMSTNTWMVPLGGLLELLDERRLAVVRPDGSLFASTPLPRDRGGSGVPSSELQIAPHADAVAFTVAVGATDSPDATRRAHGTEIVYLLRAGAHAASPLHTEHVAFAACERTAGLRWHRSWLLYSNSEGSLAVIDTTGAHRTIELTGLARRLLANRRLIDAGWGR